MQQEKTEQLAQDVIHAPQDFNRDSYFPMVGPKLSSPSPTCSIVSGKVE
jgi:hypothetical protein